MQKIINIYFFCCLLTVNALVITPFSEAKGHGYGGIEKFSLEMINPSLSTDTIIIGDKIPIDSIGNGELPIVISESGSYILTRNMTYSATGNADGITIDANNVTLDLNGFTISAGGVGNGDDGINILGSQDDILIKNGKVINWGGHGINASQADQSIFENLIVENNGEDGLRTDFSCIIRNCKAKLNGTDGIETDDGSIIINCQSHNNGDNGFQVDTGSRIQNCQSEGNIGHGFDVAGGCIISDCLASKNEEDGFELSLGSQATACIANGNGRNGFTLTSTAVLIRVKASNNGFCIDDPNCQSPPSGLNVNNLSTFGNGVTLFANSKIIDSEFSNNERVGIRVSGTDAFVSQNTVRNNKNVGILSLSSGGLFTRNKCRENGTSPNPDFVDGSNNLLQGNYEIGSNNAIGPIVNITASGDLSNIANSNHPNANFEY